VEKDDLPKALERVNEQSLGWRLQEELLKISDCFCFQLENMEIPTTFKTNLCFVGYLELRDLNKRKFVLKSMKRMFPFQYLTRATGSSVMMKAYACREIFRVGGPWLVGISEQEIQPRSNGLWTSHQTRCFYY
jgi:hypothetical protein